MAIDPLTAITPNDLAAFPDNAAINATGPSATDGTPLTAIGMNNYWHGRQQALLNYAGLTPTGVVESDTVSQELEAIKLGFGVGPGIGVEWWKADDPSVTGDRVLLFTGQGILIASYAALDAEVWVGDAGGTHNAAVHAGGGFFYRSSDAAGTTPNAAGPYLQLPDTRGYTLRGLDLAAAVDPDGASRFLGDVQLDALQGHFTEFKINIGNVGSVDGTTTNYLGKSGNGGEFIFRPTAPNVNTVIVQNPITDGVNGTPRTDSESRTTNISTKYGITY